jgi:hypothetical protein
VCNGGDVACLANAIATSNANGEVNTITLAAGTYTLTTPATPATGLPVITGTVALIGAGAAQTTITRSTLPGVPGFRLLEVASMGTLTVTGLMLTHGASGIRSGGAVLNRGTLTLMGVTVMDNATSAGVGGGGIATTSGTVRLEDTAVLHNLAGMGGGLDVTGGMVTVTRSTFRGNISQDGGAAIENGAFATAGEVHIQDSSLYGNLSEFGSSGIFNWGTMTITNTTIASNSAGSAFTDVLGVWNLGGTLHVLNSTIADHHTPFTLRPQPALLNQGGVVTVENSILAGNGVDCGGTILSLDANLLGVGCEVVLQPDDQVVTSPGLAAFVDDGLPGHAHFPLLADSPAINAAHGLTCPPQDQLGQPRHGTCDIGAVEFTKKAKKAKKLPKVARRD